MILQWQDAAYGQHYLDVPGEVTLLSTWGLNDDTAPDYQKVYGVAMQVWNEPIAADGLVGAQGQSRRVYLHVAGREAAVLRIECLNMFLLNDRGDTINTLVRGGR